MASYTAITNTLDFAVAFKPKTAFPLDARSMFGSYDAAVAAAKTAENAGSSNTTYYYGQILTVFENDVAKHYSIQGDKTLKEVGASVSGDDKTIVMNNEVLSLKNFGVQYYRYIDTVEAAEGQEAVEAHYELTTGWKEGLTPKVVKTATGTFELAWYEPSSTTVEGLQSALASVQTTVQNMDTRVTNIESKNNDQDSRLTALEADSTMFKGDATVAGSIKNLVNAGIAAQLADQPEAFDTLKEIADWCSTHSTDVIEMNKNITANATAVKALETFVGKLPEGAKASDVIGYIAEYYAEQAAKYGDIVTHNASEFATAAQGAKADSAVQKVEAGENGHIVVDGTDVKVYQPEVASTSTAGTVKVDGTSISASEAGVISVEAVDKSKVTGLDTALTTTKDNAVQDANAYTDEKSLAKTDVVAYGAQAATAETASDLKAASEKLLLSMLDWKTSM